MANKQYKPKNLRKIARIIGKDLPERGLLEQQVTTTSFGIKQTRMCLVNDPQTVRGIYRKLKKDVKRLGVNALREYGEKYVRQAESTSKET